MRVCVYECVRVCMYVCMFVCMYARMYVCMYYVCSNIRTDAELTEEVTHQLLQTYMEAHLPTVCMNNAVFLDSQISGYLTCHLSLFGRT